MKKYVLGPNAARQLKKLLRGSGEVSRRGNLSSALAFGSEYANPYAVQWAQSANDGEGGWIIWLPGDALLVVDGQTVDVREDLEAVGGDYPDGWYLLGDVIEDDGTLYLDIHFPDPEDETAVQEPTAEFSNGESADDDEDDEEDETRTVHVKVCDVATDSDTGARSVKQFVTSMILIGGGEETYIAGDGDGSEWLRANGRDIMIQGYPGSGEGAEEVDNCGLVFTTVSEREGEDGEIIPAKIIVGVRDKSSEESWAAKEMKIPIAGGGTKLVHFLGCDDVDLTGLGGGGGSGGGGESNTCKRVIKLKGDAQQSADVNGAVNVKGAQGSGLEILTTAVPPAAGQAADDNLGGDVEIDLKGRKQLQGCNKNFGLHQIKYLDKDGNTQIFHGLFCGDIDLTQMGKLIKNVTINCSAASGGTNTMVFHYTDGSIDTFTVQNGLNGSPGAPGGGGGDVDVQAETIQDNTYLYIDGELVATIPHGKTPTITADKSGKTTTIYADGVAIATINDGSDAEGGDDDDATEMTVVTGASFEISGGKLVAKLTRKRIKAVVVQDLGEQSVNVCDAKEVEVVTSESYSTSSHQFTNTRRKITVIGDVAATGQTPFTATSLASE